MNRLNLSKMLSFPCVFKFGEYGMEKKKIDWAAYDKSLRQRGSITWFSDEAIRAWSSAPTGKRGGQEKFSDLAIETSLSLRLIFKQGLRQTEGLIGSIVDMMKLDIDVPDHSTLSRRGKVISILSEVNCDSSESLVVVVDSTGLKIHGAGEWSENKHGLSKRKEWRKLHLTINESTLEIIASSLTDNHVGDPTEVPNLLDQVKNPIDEFIGDGAYDTKKVYNTVESREEKGKHDVTVPPPKNAVLSPKSKNNPTQRDEHVKFIHSNDRSSWEGKVRYYRRLLVENTISRYKGIIGAKLRAWDIEAQKNEIKIGCKILNTMLKPGTPLHPAAH